MARATRSVSLDKGCSFLKVRLNQLDSLRSDDERDGTTREVKGGGLTFHVARIPRHHEAMIVAVDEHLQRGVSHPLHHRLAVELNGERETVEFGEQSGGEPLAHGLAGAVEEVEIVVRGSHAGHGSPALQPLAGAGG